MLIYASRRGYLVSISSEFGVVEGSMDKIDFLWYGLRFICWMSLVVLIFWWYQSYLTQRFGLAKLDDYFFQGIFLSFAGAVGAFISITEKIASYRVDAHLPLMRTRINSRMRIVLGILFGNILFWFLMSGMITLVETENLNFEDYPNILLCLIIALIGGFSERIVPDILGQKEEEYSKKIIKNQDVTNKKTDNTIGGKNDHNTLVINDSLGQVDNKEKVDKL